MNQVQRTNKSKYKSLNLEETLNPKLEPKRLSLFLGSHHFNCIVTEGFRRFAPTTILDFVGLFVAFVDLGPS